jgi:hypothetical protein
MVLSLLFRIGKTILYSRLIGLEIEGRKYAAAGGDQAFFMPVP